MPPKSLNQTVQEIESKLNELVELFNNSGNPIIIEKLDDIAQDIDNQYQVTNTLTNLIGKVDMILQYVTPEVIPVSPEQKALEALQALSNLQNQLYLQSQNVPPPEMEWEPEKMMRVYFSNFSILKMLRYAKALVDFAFDGQFVIQYCETGAFVYVSFLNPQDEVVIVQFGGVVQVKEV